METKIREIIDRLDEAISYEDLDEVAEARQELLFILDELQSDFPLQNDEF